MIRLYVFSLAVLIFAVLGSKPGLAQHPPELDNLFPFAASDCVGYRLAKIGDYSAYGVRFVSWGGVPDFHRANIVQFRAHFRDAAKTKTTIAAKIGTRTEYKGFIDSNAAHVLEARTVNLQGVPYLVPDADKGSTYKGHNPFWFCTNNEAFKRYIQNKLVGSVGPLAFGLTIDDPEGSSVLTLNREGCYCTSCVTKFSKYLQRTFSPSQLAAFDIINPATFDVRQVHLRHSEVPISKRPMYKEYEAFQIECMVTFINDIMSYYKTISKRNIVRGVNIAPYSWLAYHLKDSLDYFTSEITEGASGESLASVLPVLAFKLADAYRKPGVFMATGEDNYLLQRDGRPTLLDAWIAEAYANGHYFMAPIEYFYYSKQEGKSGFFKPSDQTRHQNLYAFIKKNAALFDNLSSTAFVCVAISPETIRFDSKKLEEIVRVFSSSNTPFDIVFPEMCDQHAKAGGDGARAYTHVLFLDKGKYTEQDRSKFMSRRAPGAMVIKSPGEATSLRVVHNASGPISVVPRSNSTKLVLHVLNRTYNNVSDSLETTGPLTVMIPASYLAGKLPKTVTYVMASGGSSAVPQTQGSVPLVAVRDGYELTLPSVPFWCIVEIRFA